MEVAISLLIIIVTIVLNLIPAEVNRFTVESIEEEESIRFTKQDNGSWKAVVGEQEEKFTIRVKGTECTLSEGERTQTIDLADHLGINKKTDWENLKTLKIRGGSVEIGRKPEGFDLLFRDDVKGREDYRVKVRWEREDQGS